MRVSALFLAVPLLQGCGNTVDIPGSWSNSTIIIDGRADEWSSSLVPIKDTPVSLAMRNDQDYLYLCLESSDRTFRRQMVGAGMTVWFEPQGADKIGIHFPLAMSGTGMMPAGGPPESGLPGGEPPERGLPEQGMGQAQAGSVPDVVKELEILGPGKDDVDRMPVQQAAGIEVRLGQSAGMMVYELKIPLRKTEKHPYALASNPGTKVNINFETGKMTRPSGRPGGMAGGSGGEGSGFPGAGPGGGMGPAPGGMGPVDGGDDGGGTPGGRMPGSMGGGRRGGKSSEGREEGNRSAAKRFTLEVELTLASGPAR